MCNIMYMFFFCNKKIHIVYLNNLYENNMYIKIFCDKNLQIVHHWYIVNDLYIKNMYIRIFFDKKGYKLYNCR